MTLLGKYNAGVVGLLSISLGWLRNASLIATMFSAIIIGSNSKIAFAEDAQPAGPSSSDFINIISSLTCETQGLAGFVLIENAHSCIPDAMSSLMVANLISPGLYMATMLKLKIGDPSILPNNCSRANRAGGINIKTGEQLVPMIDFAFCNNILLQVQRMVAVAKAQIAVIQAILIGSDPWKTIVDAIALNPRDYHEYFRKAEGDSGVFIDLPFPLPWTITREADKLCVSTYTIWGATLHVGCKYIKEPFPNSIYAQFFNTPNGGGQFVNGVEEKLMPQDVRNFIKCSTAGGCAALVNSNTQTMFSISGGIITCVRQMLSMLINNSGICVLDAANNATPHTDGSFFWQFQKNMHRAVMAFLTIYVIFIGIKILLAGEELPKGGEFAMYAIKLILVIYFAVGINISSGDDARFDGMTSWIFPFFLNAGATIGGWIMNASPSQLCLYTPESYTDGMGYLALWDSLDCKVGHYIGIDAILNSLTGGSEGDNLNYSIPPYVFLLIPALYSGQLSLLMLVISYPLVVMSVAAYMVNSYVVCLIAITILGILAPLYVPMALFERTKGYFESWYKLMISFVLQPVVVVGFMTLMFAIFDVGFYGTCQYLSVPVLMQNNQDGGAFQKKKISIIDTNPNNYAPEDFEGCTNSLGWLFNAPGASMTINSLVDIGNGEKGIIKGPKALEYANYVSQHGIMGPIHSTAGVFMTFYEFVGELDKQFILNLFACLLMLYLMNELSGQLSDFAADIAQSVSLSGVAIPSSPKKIQQAMQSQAQKAKESKEDSQKEDELNKRQGAVDSAKGGGPRGGGSEGARGGNAAPKVGGSSSGVPKAPMK